MAQSSNPSFPSRYRAGSGIYSAGFADASPVRPPVLTAQGREDVERLRAKVRAHNPGYVYTNGVSLPSQLPSVPELLDELARNVAGAKGKAAIPSSPLPEVEPSELAKAGFDWRAIADRAITALEKGSHRPLPLANDPEAKDIPGLSVIASAGSASPLGKVEETSAPGATVTGGSSPAGEPVDSQQVPLTEPIPEDTFQPADSPTVAVPEQDSATPQQVSPGSSPESVLSQPQPFASKDTAPVSLSPHADDIVQSSGKYDGVFVGDVDGKVAVWNPVGEETEAEAAEAIFAESEPVGASAAVPEPAAEPVSEPVDASVVESASESVSASPVVDSAAVAQLQSGEPGGDDLAPGSSADGLVPAGGVPGDVVAKGVVTQDLLAQDQDLAAQDTVSQDTVVDAAQAGLFDRDREAAARPTESETPKAPETSEGNTLAPEENTPVSHSTVESEHDSNHDSDYESEHVSEHAEEMGKAPVENADDTAQPSGKYDGVFVGDVDGKVAVWNPAEEDTEKESAEAADAVFAASEPAGASTAVPEPAAEPVSESVDASVVESTSESVSASPVVDSAAVAQLQSGEPGGDDLVPGSSADGLVPAGGVPGDVVAKGVVTQDLLAQDQDLAAQDTVSQDMVVDAAQAGVDAVQAGLFDRDREAAARPTESETPKALEISEGNTLAPEESTPVSRSTVESEHDSNHDSDYESEHVSEHAEEMGKAPVENADDTVQPSGEHDDMPEDEASQPAPVESPEGLEFPESEAAPGVASEAEEIDLTDDTDEEIPVSGEDFGDTLADAQLETLEQEIPVEENDLPVREADVSEAPNDGTSLEQALTAEEDFDLDLDTLDDVPPVEDTVEHDVEGSANGVDTEDTVGHNPVTQLLPSDTGEASSDFVEEPSTVDEVVAPDEIVAPDKVTTPEEIATPETASGETTELTSELPGSAAIGSEAVMTEDEEPAEDSTTVDLGSADLGTADLAEFSVDEPEPDEVPQLAEETEASPEPRDDTPGAETDADTLPDEDALAEGAAADVAEELPTAESSEEFFDNPQSTVENQPGDHEDQLADVTLDEEAENSDVAADEAADTELFANDEEAPAEEPYAQPEEPPVKKGFFRRLFGR